MKQEPSDSRRTAWRAFLQAYATVLPTLERELREERGLPLVWFDVLAQLTQSPEEGRLRMRDLAGTVLLISRSGLTRLVERMEKEGLVVREHSLEDRRNVYAVITPKGRTTLEGGEAGPHEGRSGTLSATPE